VDKKDDVDGASIIFADGLERALDEGLAIGRDDANDLVLVTKTVSRQHAQLLEHEGRWYVVDRGSFNGTLLNGTRLQPGIEVPLRHGDRLELGSQLLVFSQPSELQDPDRTDAVESADDGVGLSPLQREVVRALCSAWLAGGTLEELPSNEEIAARLGTPGAVGTVKAALRRAYAKAGVSGLPAHAKRRALCRIARQRGWI
jgi:DNA-binding CsgD family transcriptional regulator